MTETRNCRTCKHNTYADIENCRWFDCSHPKTIAKAPKMEDGDPAFISLMTTDFPLSWLHNTDNCPTWEVKI